jgi:hypothetical protein
MKNNFDDNETLGKKLGAVQFVDNPQLNATELFLGKGRIRISPEEEINISNVDDGLGREINISVHNGEIKIEAGCFSGTLDEFCEKAESENKKRYSRVVRAAAEALQADVVDNNITGGW